MSYLPNLPDDVQAKIGLLAPYKSQMTSLELQLQKIRMDYDQIQSELLKYRIDRNSSSSKVIITTAPLSIGKLPTEMLLHTFEFFLSTNHRRIRTLLTVCKRWYGIVMHSPRLWATIQLSTIPYADYQNLPKSLVLYIEACLERSQSLLLDIDVDYRAFRSRDEYIRDLIEITVGHIADESESDGIIEWVLGLDCDFASEKFDAYFLDTLEALDLLVGPDGRNMERWQSLNLSIPSWRGHNVALQIWEKFVGNTPNLTQASFKQLEQIFDSINDDDDEVAYLLGFPTLSGLRSLTIDEVGANGFLDRLSMVPSALCQLDLHYNYGLVGISDLSKFPLLRKLSLRTDIDASAEVGYFYREKAYPLFVIQLPQLQELHLFGNPHILRHVEFDTPSLNKLLLCSRNGFHLHPSLSPTHVHWSIVTPVDTYWTPATTFSALVTMVKSSKRIEVITIQEFALAYIPLVISDLKRSSSLPMSLKSVVVELADGLREVVDVEKYREMVPENVPNEYLHLVSGSPTGLAIQMCELNEIRIQAQATSQTDQQHLVQMQQTALEMCNRGLAYPLVPVSRAALADYSGSASFDGVDHASSGVIASPSTSNTMGGTSNVLGGDEPLPRDLFIGLGNGMPFDFQMMGYQQDDTFTGNIKFDFASTLGMDDNYNMSMYINEGGLDSVDRENGATLPSTSSLMSAQPPGNTWPLMSAGEYHRIPPNRTTPVMTPLPFPQQGTHGGGPGGPPMGPGMPSAMVGQLCELTQTHMRTQATSTHQTDQQYFAQMQQTAVNTYNIKPTYPPTPNTTLAGQPGASGPSIRGATNSPKGSMLPPPPPASSTNQPAPGGTANGIGGTMLARFSGSASPNGAISAAGGTANSSMSSAMGGASGMLGVSEPLSTDLFMSLGDSAPFDFQMMGYQEDDAFMGNMNFDFASTLGMDDNYNMSMYINEGGLDSVDGT